MAVPNEKLQQVLQEIQEAQQKSAQQLGLVKSQIASKNRESRMLQLSEVELDTLPKETPIYDGVGKMWDIGAGLAGRPRLTMAIGSSSPPPQTSRPVKQRKLRT